MADDLRGPWTVDEDDRPGMEWNRDILDVDGNTVCFMAHSNGRAPDKDAAKARAVAALPDLMNENKRLRLAEPKFIAAMEMCGVSEATQGAVMACWKAKMENISPNRDEGNHLQAQADSGIEAKNRTKGNRPA